MEVSALTYPLSPSISPNITVAESTVVAPERRRDAVRNADWLAARDVPVDVRSRLAFRDNPDRGHAGWDRPTFGPRFEPAVERPPSEVCPARDAFTRHLDQGRVTLTFKSNQPLWIRLCLDMARTVCTAHTFSPGIPCEARGRGRRRRGRSPRGAQTQKPNTSSPQPGATLNSAGRTSTRVCSARGPVRQPRSSTDRCTPAMRRFGAIAARRPPRCRSEQSPGPRGGATLKLLSSSLPDRPAMVREPSPPEKHPPRIGPSTYSFALPTLCRLHVRRFWSII